MLPTTRDLPTAETTPRMPSVIGTQWAVFSCGWAEIAADRIEATETTSRMMWAARAFMAVFVYLISGSSRVKIVGGIGLSLDSRSFSSRRITLGRTASSRLAQAPRQKTKSSAASPSSTTSSELTGLCFLIARMDSSASRAVLHQQALDGTRIHVRHDVFPTWAQRIVLATGPAKGAQGRACGNAGAPVRNPRRPPAKPSCRRAAHARRRPGVKVSPQGTARVPARRVSGREPDQEGDLPRP